MSCIALSVGLGNVWRFPFTALDNGGGAFVIPYVIVLFLVGKPVYYLEMVIGQFSGRSSINAFDLCPITRGKIMIGFTEIFLNLFDGHCHRNWCRTGIRYIHGNRLLCLIIGDYNALFCGIVL